MENKKKFFKFAWIPAVLSVGFLLFAGFMAWRESNFKCRLTKLALEGNPYAIGIMIKYEKPWRLNEKVVDEALKGNPYALEILAIDKKSDCSAS